MKKFLCSTLFVLLSAVASFAAAKDFIVLLDTSEGMFDNYDKLVRNYFPEVVKDHLKARDVFHLISFAEQPELELSQKIDTKDDMEVVLKRLLLLQPLAKYSDTLLAFRFLYQYASSLPSYQAKTIVIFTNGIYKPSPAQAVKKSVAQKEIESILQQVKSKGWDVRLVQLTPSPAPNSAATTSSKSEEQLNLSELAGNGSVPLYQFKDEANFSNLTLGSPRITFPKDLGKIGSTFSFSFGIENPRDASVLLRVRELLYNGENILKERAVITLSSKETKSVSLSAGFTKTPANGSNTGTFSLTFDDDMRAYPTEGQVQFEYSSGWEGFWIPVGIVLGVLLFVGLVIFVVVLIRKGYEHGKRVADTHVQKASMAIPARDEEQKTSIPILVQEKESSQQYLRSASTEKKSLLETSRSTESNPTLSASFKDDKVAAEALLQSQTARKNEGEALLRTSSVKPGQTELLKTKPTLETSAFEKKELPEPSSKSKEAESILASAKKSPQNVAQELNAMADSSKKDYEMFLKSATKEPKKANLGSPIRRVNVPVKVTDVNAPTREFKMTVWTPDLVYQNMLQGANIVSFKPGDRKTVGSTKAHFKILLATVSDAIAEVIYDGENLAFVPLVPELFPGISGQLDSCLGTDILVQLNESKSIHLSFSKFVSKTEITNRILTGQATLEEKSSK